MFEWIPAYSVGIASIDAQHQNLFAIAGELYRAMGVGQGKSTLGRILDRLVRYTAMHFAHEERLMRQHAYPDFEKHKAEHEALTRQVIQFQNEFQAGKVAMTVQVLQFLRQWLEHHIREADQRYAPYLKPQAVA